MTKEIVLTKKQQEGLDIAVERFNSGETHTTIAGYAGTGKTFLVNQIIKELGLSEDEYAMATFTGKAALRLQQGGFTNARTLHKLLYDSIPIKKNRSSAAVQFAHKPIAFNILRDSGIKLIVVDEVSMVPNNILMTLAKHNIHTIALGDPGQLPPVGTDNGMLDNPHIFLTEIQRQAADNPIIKLSKQIREGEKIDVINNDKVQMFSRDELSTGMLLWADQVICAKNNTRGDFNNVMRNELGFTSAVPAVGEKIIVTRNNWDFTNETGHALVNGMLAEVTESRVEQDYRAQLLGQESLLGFLTIQPDFDSGEFRNVKYDALTFSKGKESYDMDMNTKNAYLKMNGVDFGYAITCHKSQGSEFGNVLVYEEKLNNKEHRRWLYTAVTRAVDKVVIIYDKASGVWNI